MAPRIFKALASLTKVQKASRGSITNFLPSLGDIPQPLELMSQVSVQAMRDTVMNTPTAAACVNAILDFACSVSPTVRNVDPSQPPQRNHSNFVWELLEQPNPQTIGYEFRRAWFRDMLTFGYGALEKERNASGSIANLWVLDASKLQIRYDSHGTILGYNQLSYDQTSWIKFDKENVVYTPLDTTSSGPYPIPRIAQLYSCAVLEAAILTFIHSRFTESNIPYGLINIGDVTKEQLEDAIMLWNQQMEQLGKHKIMLTGSKAQRMDFITFAGQLKDLDATNLLLQVRSQIMSILGVTVNELGQAADVNKSNGFNLSYSFKKRAIEPLLNTAYGKFTADIIWNDLGWKTLEVGYEEIDSRDELLQAQIDQIHLNTGIMSINDIRNRRGDKDIPGGEEPYIILGTNAVPVSMLREFAQVQLDALISVNQQVQATIAAAGMGGDLGQPLGSPPLVRGAQPPERFTTPLGRGSSTTKFKLPNPQPIPTNANGKSNQPARGAVQANRNQGVRKEDMSP